MRIHLTTLLLLAIVFSACESADPMPTEVAQVEAVDASKNGQKATAPDKLADVMAQANARLAAEGAKLRIAYAEYLTDAHSDKVGQIVYANDRGNKQLEGDFVPGELQLLTDGTNNVTYYVDNTRPSQDLPAAATEAAIDRAMATWDAEKCSDLGMTKIPFNPAIRTGYVAAIIEAIFGPLGFGGSFNYVADVVHAGWLPALFFDIIAENGSDYILGITFTIIWTDEDGNEVDTDNNGKYDVAWREIYYNDAFPWAINSHFDVESIALHEAGHALSQAHFGKIFETKNGKLHFAPLAVMNAAYSQIQQDLTGTDRGGHCSNWAQWPSN